MDFLIHPDPEHAKRLLKQSGYDGRPVVVLQVPDYGAVGRLPVVASQLLRNAGFHVEVQSMDRNTQQARLARKTGWNVTLSRSSLASQLSPIPMNQLSAACSKAMYGWPCDSQVEELRDAFALAGDEEARKRFAEAVQVRAMEVGVYVPLGEFRTKAATRKGLTGFVDGFFIVLWNVEKQ